MDKYISTNIKLIGGKKKKTKKLINNDLNENIKEYEIYNNKFNNKLENTIIDIIKEFVSEAYLVSETDSKKINQFLQQMKTTNLNNLSEIEDEKKLKVNGNFQWKLILKLIYELFTKNKASKNRNIYECLVDGDAGNQFSAYKCYHIENSSDKCMFVTLDPYYLQILGKSKSHKFIRISICNPDRYGDRLINNSSKKLVLKINKGIEDNTFNKDNSINILNLMSEDSKIPSKLKNHKMADVFRVLFNYIVTRQTKFVAMLGKARFNTSLDFTIDELLANILSLDKLLHKQNTSNFKGRKITYNNKTNNKLSYNLFTSRVALNNESVASSLLFRDSNLGFVTGGYNGYSHFGEWNDENNNPNEGLLQSYGITRSGYEIAKKYDKPVIGVMCKGGMHAYNQNPDANGIYGDHWGDDTPGLSFVSDAAIIQAPYGAWTQIELAYFSARKKPVCIYVPIEFIDKNAANKILKSSSSVSVKNKKDNKNKLYELLKNGISGADKRNLDELKDIIIKAKKAEKQPMYEFHYKSNPIPIFTDFNKASKYIHDELNKLEKKNPNYHLDKAKDILMAFNKSKLPSKDKPKNTKKITLTLDNQISKYMNIKYGTANDYLAEDQVENLTTIEENKFFKQLKSLKKK